MEQWSPYAALLVSIHFGDTKIAARIQCILTIFLLRPRELRAAMSSLATIAVRRLKDIFRITS
jgi:hypothetical protein